MYAPFAGTYNPVTDAIPADEVARATKGVLLGLVLGTVIALLARRARGNRD